MCALLRAAITLASSASFAALRAAAIASRSDRISADNRIDKRAQVLQSCLPQVQHVPVPPRLTRVPRVLLVFESLW